ncbi:MAG: Crp/Fnr family transcriptional regulator [Actinomycetota bacterium]
MDVGESGGFIASLSREELDDLKGRGRTRTWPRGANLFVEGDRSEHVALITSGRVKVSYYTEDGREIVLALREPGDLLGDQSGLDGGPRGASASALESVQALVIQADDFKAFLEEHPRVALLLLKMLSLRLRDADRKRIEFGAYDSVGRVARRLVELAERFGETSQEGIRITAPLSQQELAAWTGSSREAVSKALQTLRERGWIETHRRGITVVDLDALSRRAT